MFPTAAKMVAALCMVILAWVVSEQVKPLYPEGSYFGIFNYVNVAVGFLCGWIIVGRRSGRGMAAAISHGVTGTVAAVFWAIFIQAANEMTKLAMRHRYDGPFDAIAAVFEISVEYLALIATANIVITLFVGGCLVGVLAELAWRSWR